jgi:ABC-type uncharacterized transport system auxiliary subunit
MSQQSALVPLLCIALLSGCASGLRSDDAPTVTYVLSGAAVPQDAARGVANAAPVSSSAVQSATLRVLTPVALPGYETDRLVLLAPGHRLDVFAASRWSGPVTELVGALAAQALRERAGFGAVHDEGAPFSSDVMLRIVVRRFDADYTGSGLDRAPTIRIVLDCALGRRADRLALGTFTIASAQVASEDRLAAVVDAFDLAATDAMRQLVTRTRETLERTAADVLPAVARPGP